MSTLRLRTVSALSATAAAVAALAGCASSGGSQHGSTVDPAEFAADIAAGYQNTTSAHMSFTVSADGQTLSGQADQTIANGVTDDMDLTESIPGAGDFRIRIVDGASYAQLPDSLGGDPDKPWALLSTTSSNPAVATMASSLSGLGDSSSVETIKKFADAADSVEDLGPSTQDGQSTTHYRVTVDVSKIADSGSGGSTVADLKQAGIGKVPTDIYLDAQHRPVLLTMTFKVQGHTGKVSFTVTDYDKPLTITAPPADQISTD